ncbi:MAG: ribonuclease Z [Bacteroidota bacterium]
MAKKFEVTILGVNSAYPIHGRHPSCQIVNYNDRLYMIDCGEAAQIQLSKYSIKKGKIDHVFISHLHGDHCYGLPGLLTSFALQGRKSTLHVHGPIGIQKFIEDIFKASGAFMPFDLDICEYDTEVETKINVNPNLTVETFPLKHRVPTMGFRFKENLVEWNIRSEAISRYDLSIEDIKAVKKGKTIVRNGKEVDAKELTYPKTEPRSYAYCSDTVYDPELIPAIQQTSLLYHETTYLDDLKELAEERMHSTLGQAIDLAVAAGIKRLIIGHFSSRYRNTEVFLDAGIDRFEGLLLGEEGRVYKI